MILFLKKDVKILKNTFNSSNTIKIKGIIIKKYFDNLLRNLK